MKDPAVKKYIIKLVAKEVKMEVRRMASDSADFVLKSNDPEQLKSFTWDILLTELSRFAPVLLNILVGATQTRVPRPNTNAVIVCCCHIETT